MILSNKYAGKNIRGRKGYFKDPYIEVKIAIPKSVYTQLQKVADSYSLDMKNLLCRFIYSNRSNTLMGDLDLTIPQIGGSSENDRMKLWTYLNKAGTIGINLDYLVMVWDDVGFLSEKHILCTISDLLYMGLIELVNIDDDAVAKLRVTESVKIKNKHERFNMFAGAKIK